ncbi:hypothetical protein [Cellulophaga omnivescoria]|uniref:hypothetical protein n=1 Tax=Cellulophaga omnivescoria TaxID=1888890 RepID=UPI000987A02B|nr:hypothetical protein [Cellulophaga omnivescoria]
MKIRNLIPFKTSILSAPINKLLGFALILLVLLTSSVASAQLFPVQVSPQLTPPYSLKLSDYSTSTTEKLLVNLLLTDVNESDLQVRLRFSISGNSVNIQSKDFVQNAAPIQLTGGIPLRLSNLDLQPYFDLQNLDGITPSEYSKPLPDGLYQFCFEVFDWTTGRPLSEKKCYPVYLVLNDPPFLNLPQNGEQVPAQDPQNIIFQWTPRHVNATGVEYEFELRELWDTNVDPQAAFLASPNLYQTKGFANTLLYGPGETSLLEGKTYGWRVRAIVSDGISETAVFKNGGYSEIFYFTYTGKCDAPQYILAKSEGTTTEEITWQQNPDHINYQIQFRKEGGSNNVWFESQTVETKKKLFFLEAETTYEYRVGGQCVQNGGYSYSAINTFTTPGKEDASEYNCGIPPEIVITNQDPLQLLGVNDVFTAGDFPVTVKEVNGGNGNYTGWGFIVVPYLGDTQIRVTFNNIQINTDKQLTNGIVETEYDEKFATTGGAGMSDVSELTELIEGDNDIDELNVNFVIPPDYFEDYITVEDGQIVIRNPNDAQVRTSPLGDDKVIVDSAGNTYHVDAEGNVTKGGKIDKGGPVNPDNVEGVTKNGDIESLTAKGITVTFNTRGTYGYDKLPTGINNTKLNEEYKTIKDAQGANYEIVNHVAEKNNSSLITATVSISNSDYTIDDLIFKTKQGELLTHTKATNNTINLSVQGRYTFENEPIYAVVKSKQDTTKQQTAGAFNLWHLSRKTVDVVLVSVNGAQLPTAIDLNTIFNQASTTLNIETKSVSLTNGLLGADNKLEIGDKPWLNTYNQEQKAIIADLKQKIDYQKDKYYVFTFNSSFNTTKSIAGFMPLKRQFGFVFNGGLSSDEEGKGDLAKVTAHEVAHGIFALQHPFTTYGDDIKGKTPWLMDYANGDLLSHMDWAQIHNPNLKFYIFQDEEDGESTKFSKIPAEFSNGNGTFTFMTLNGSYITLPSDIKDIVFSTGLNEIEKYIDYPVGAILGFTIGDEEFEVDVDRSTNFTNVITKEDLTFTYKGFISKKTKQYYESTQYNQERQELIALFPYFEKGSTYEVISYRLQKCSVPSSVSFAPLANNKVTFNLIDDYQKLKSIYQGKTELYKDYDYQNVPFPGQYEVNASRMTDILRNITGDYMICAKLALLNNTQPLLFKDFISEKFGINDYDELFLNHLNSEAKIKNAYIDLINYFTKNSKDNTSEFISLVDNFNYDSASSFDYEEVYDKWVRISTEDIIEYIPITTRKKALDLFIEGFSSTLSSSNLNNLHWHNGIARLIKFSKEKNNEYDDKKELYEFITKEENKYVWQFLEDANDVAITEFMNQFTLLSNDYGDVDDRIKILKTLDNKDDWGSKSEKIIAGTSANLTDANSLALGLKLKENPILVKKIFETLDNISDNTELNSFIQNISKAYIKSFEGAFPSSVYGDYATIDYLNTEYDKLKKIPEDTNYIPFHQISLGDKVYEVATDAIFLRHFLFEGANFSTKINESGNIEVKFSIKHFGKSDKEIINRTFNPMDLVYLDFKGNIYLDTQKFDKGSAFMVPAIFLHWLQDSIVDDQIKSTVRIAADILAIAAAPATFGASSTFLIALEQSAAGIDIYMMLQREEVADYLGEDIYPLWDNMYTIYQVAQLPSAIKGLYQTVAVGGKNVLKFGLVTKQAIKTLPAQLKGMSSGNRAILLTKLNNTYKELVKYREFFPNTASYDQILEGFAELTLVVASEAKNAFITAKGKFDYYKKVYNVTAELEYSLFKYNFEGGDDALTIYNTLKLPNSLTNSKNIIVLEEFNAIDKSVDAATAKWQIVENIEDGKYYIRAATADDLTVSNFIKKLEDDGFSSLKTTLENLNDQGKLTKFADQFSELPDLLNALNKKPKSVEAWAVLDDIGVDDVIKIDLENLDEVSELIGGSYKTWKTSSAGVNNRLWTNIDFTGKYYKVKFLDDVDLGVASSSYTQATKTIEFDLNVPPFLQKQGVASEIYAKGLANHPETKIIKEEYIASSRYIGGEPANLTEFKKLINGTDAIPPVSPKEAAFLTPSGKTIKRNNFDAEPEILINTDNNVTIQFRRAGSAANTVVNNIDDFARLSKAQKLSYIEDAWKAYYPQIFFERKLFEDMMGNYRYLKTSGWGHTDEIASNFKAIDFYKNGTSSGNNIFTETVVSMKTTTVTDVNKWLESNAIKNNLDNLIAGKGANNGITWNGKTIIYNKVEVHIYMPKEKFKDAIKNEWLNTLKVERPTIDFKINTLEEFIP